MARTTIGFVQRIARYNFIGFSRDLNAIRDLVEIEYLSFKLYIGTILASFGGFDQHQSYCYGVKPFSYKMELPIVVGPLQRGRQILNSLTAVKRPDLFEGPTCPECGSDLSDDLIEKMEIQGIEYCPVCILERVHPLAHPVTLKGMTDPIELEWEITDKFQRPSDDVTEANAVFPGVYILWSPPQANPLEEVLNSDSLSLDTELGTRLEKAGKHLPTIFHSAKGNGLLYVGQSKNVVERIWKHCQGDGARLMSIMTPSQLVAVNWKPPGYTLRELEREVGEQVRKAVIKEGYDIAVYWD